MQRVRDRSDRRIRLRPDDRRVQRKLDLNVDLREVIEAHAERRPGLRHARIVLHVLDGGLGPVGVILLISSRRGGQIIANLSSWYVQPQWRAHSTLLI